jgi:L-threonylcarbamoyladenylate synthase
VDAFNQKAVEELFILKGRPKDKPFVFQVDSVEEAQQLVAEQFLPFQIELMKKYWPGEVTFIFNKSKVISSYATAGMESIAVRISAHPLMQNLLKKYKKPLAVPSANISGDPPAKNVIELKRIFGDKICCYLESDQITSDIASSVVDIRSEKIKVLRQGRVTVKL